MAEDKRETDGVSEQHKETAQVATIDADAKRTAGQRMINATWEITQAIIAVAVTGTTLCVCAYLVTRGEGGSGAFLILSNVFFLVVGTYFQRTNHTKSANVQEDHR